MKKYNKHILIVVFATLFNIVGCSDFLETEPESYWKDESFYSTTEEVQLALSGIYGQLADDQVYGWVFNVLMEAGTDETYTNDPSNAVWDLSKYAHTSSSNDIKNIWLRFYTCIHLVNQLEKNTNANLFTEEEYNKVLGKARFMRAFSYFNLANWFGPVPLRLTPSQSQEDNNLAPSSLLEIYTQVETDFLFAAEHLDHANSPDYIPGEPNKMAAHGMLARLYLRMGGFQPYLTNSEATSYFDNPQQYFVKAKDQCEIIFNDGWHGITSFSVDPESYRNHFLSYLQDRYDLKESLFEISFGHLTDVGLNVSGRLGNINGIEFVGTADIPRAFCKINVGLPLYNIYSQEDKRREWNIAGYRNNYIASTQNYRTQWIYDFPLNQEFGPGKFRRWEPKDLEAVKLAGSVYGAEYDILNDTPGSDIDGNFTSINFPILRYSDILLMHAEAIIGSKNGSTDATSEALNSLNLVRERAGLEPYIGSLSHDDFFEVIVDERLRELCFEQLRKQDLIRWNMLEEKLIETNAMIEANSGFSASDQFHQTYLAPGNNFDRSKHFTFPYPQQEVLINQSLNQKPNW